MNGSTPVPENVFVIELTDPNHSNTHNTSDVLDIVVTRKLEMSLDVVSLNEGSSDYYPLLITLGSDEEDPDKNELEYPHRR